MAPLLVLALAWVIEAKLASSDCLGSEASITCAVSADTECDEEGEACAISALQLRGQQKGTSVAKKVRDEKADIQELAADILERHEEVSVSVSGGDFGFEVGDAVRTTISDDDIYEGEVGTVKSFTADRVRVTFAKGTWAFEPGSLQKIVFSRGDTIQVLKTVAYSGQDPYPAGTMGKVLKIDKTGDASVQWDGLGKHWLLSKDFGSVKVVHQVLLSSGDVIKVVTKITYFLGQANEYDLQPGMRGKVISIDSNGDAWVQWDELGSKWLMAKDFGAVERTSNSVDTGTTLDLAKGARVEVFYGGNWYPGVIVNVPDDAGSWGVRCDGVTRTAFSKYIRPLPGSGLAATLYMHVEAEYGGKWYPGFVHKIPTVTGDGTWKVQCDVDQKDLLTDTQSIRPVQGQASRLVRALDLKPGGQVGVPGAAEQKVDVNKQIAAYIVLLRSPEWMDREVLGHMVSFGASDTSGDWPQTSEYYKGLGGMTGLASAQLQMCRYVIVMRVWLLQTLRGLNQGRLGGELQKWFGSDDDSTRAYATATVTLLYNVFGRVKLIWDQDYDGFGLVQNEGSCEHPKFTLDTGITLVHLGSAFFNGATVDLDSFTTSGSKGGTLMHELSHTLKDESTTKWKWAAWAGDAPESSGNKCGDLGQVGTTDFIYGPEACESLARTRPRDARHNADSVQFFIETSVLSERRNGFAVRLSMDGQINK